MFKHGGSEDGRIYVQTRRIGGWEDLCSNTEDRRMGEWLCFRVSGGASVHRELRVDRVGRAGRRF